jgi:hypothetical protein
VQYQEHGLPFPERFATLPPRTHTGPGLGQREETRPEQLLTPAVPTKLKAGFEIVGSFNVSFVVELSRKGGFMKKIWLSIGLVSVLALPAIAQDKEADRV